MRTVSRRYTSYRWLVAVLAADVLGLTALLLNQWLAYEAWLSWLLAAVVTAAVAPWLLKLADQVFAGAGRFATIPMTGEKNP